MLNSDNADFKYHLSSNNQDITFFGSLDSDYSEFSWNKTNSKMTAMSSLHKLKKSFLPNDLKSNENPIYNENCNSECIELYIDNNAPLKIPDLNPVVDLVSEPRIILSTSRFSRSIITTKNIKALVSNNVLNRLPSDVQQHLVTLMPICDQIIPSDGGQISLSNKALDNEFFNRALIRYLWKLTKGKTISSKEVFLNRIKRASARKLSKVMTSSSDCVAVASYNSDSPLKSNSVASMQPATRLDYYDDGDVINDASVNYNGGLVESPPQGDTNREYGNTNNTRNDTEVRSSNYFVGNWLPSAVGTFGASYDTLIDSELDTLQRHFASDIPTSDRCQRRLSNDHSVVKSPKSGKYNRRHSDGTVPLVLSTRPTRSTAGQLPARLKSSSPQSATTTQGMIISTLLGRSQSPKSNKSLVGRKKQKEKRKYKGSDQHNSNQKSAGLQELKPATFHNDTILLNLRTKLSKRMAKNSLKDFSNHYPRSNSNIDLHSDTNCFNSKSPASLSPDSDKIPFVDSPISKTSQNNFRHLKFRNQYFENQLQTPSSPQWSFSSEFTSQSSVESVLSQKNMRIDLEDVPVQENLLEDMDTEEMPPPRRTLTVAAMREKMRAKKMAKEEKRKDFDKEFPFDVDRLDESKALEMLDRDSQSSTMSNMMGMCQDNDDDNMANEFDSFLIDDYHEEIDDKILNYSDDLDDLLLTGGNESLLEIIMKDPDAMEIGNDNFGTLNASDGHHRSPMGASDHSKCLLSSSSDTSTDNHISQPLITNHQLSSSSSSVSLSLSTNSSGLDHQSILSQALTSVIQKSDPATMATVMAVGKSLASQNAYLVDGNGLSDALKLIQSLHPSAKVTTQQFYLVNRGGPQLVLSQAPPTQACSTRPISSNHVTTTTNSTTTGNNLSSTVSVLPQISAFTTKPSTTNNNNNLYSNITTCKLPPLQSATVTPNSQPMSPIFTNQKPIQLTNQNNPNPFGIRVQLAPNFSSGQQLNIIQSSSPVTSQLLNQSVQFIPQQQPQNCINNNISLITQSQPMSKFVFLYPNQFTPEPQQQQLYLLSSEPAPIAAPPTTFQVINGSNIWQQINPNLSSFLGNNNNNNSLVLMNPQALNNQSFAFNYHHQSPLIAASGSNLLMMSTTQGPRIVNNPPQPTQQQLQQQQHNKTIASQSLSVAVSKLDDDDSNLLSGSHQMNVNSNSSSIEQLSNSSSSANSKLSLFDEKICCKSQCDHFVDSDQEKSISSPQFPLLNTTQLANQKLTTSAVAANHFDSVSPSNSLYHSNGNVSIKSQNEDLDTDYDQSDFEIPCLYSTKIDKISIDKVNGNLDI